MSKIKNWMHSMTERFYEKGAKATAKEYNTSEDEVLAVVSMWEGNETWEPNQKTDTSSK